MHYLKTIQSRTLSAISFRTLAFVATFVLASVLAFLFLGGSSAAEELVTQAPAVEDPPPPTEPTADELRAIEQRKTTTHWRRKSDYWAHKRRTHFLRAHGLLPAPTTLERELERTAFWKRKAKAQQRRYVMWLCARPRPVVRNVTVKGVRASYVQRRNLTRALNKGRRMRASRKSMIAAIAAITQESSAYNKPEGDGSSVGVLQLIDIHGSVQWRMRVENSAGWHFSRSININHHVPYLSPGALAQEVQGSAHPTLYNQWVPEAQRTYRRYLGPCRR